MAKKTIGIKSTPAQKPKSGLPPEQPKAETEQTPTPTEAIADADPQPSGDGGATDALPDSVPAEAVPVAAAKTVLFELPLGEVSDGEYLSTHVEARLKTREQQLAMKRLLRGLQKVGAKTKDGRPVQRLGEAIRWVLERIAAPGAVITEAPGRFNSVPTEQITAEGGSHEDCEVKHAIGR